MSCKLRVFIPGGAIGLGLLLAFSVGGGLGLATSAQADDRTWTGTSSASWGVEGNWYPTQVPTSLDHAIFPSPIPTPSGATITLPSGASVNNITFNNSYTLSGGDLTFGGTFTVASGYTATISTTLVGAGNLTKAGTGMLTVSGSSANTYTGTTTVSQGRLHLDKSSGVVAVNGDLVISGGCVTFNANEQIANTATVTMSGSTSALNGTGANQNHRNGHVETIAKLIVTGGAFTTGSGSTWTISGQGSFTGGTGNTVFVGSSGSQISFKSLEITGMNATAGGAVGTSNSFTLYGSVSQRTTLTVGSDGLTLNGSTINLRRGTASDAAGSRVVLDGNVTTTGSSASSIKEDTAGGTIGQIGVELSSTDGTVNRTFNIGGGGADLTISIPISNGAATTAGITKTGTGTLTLSGNNTYTGTTEVQVGTLKMAHANALGTTDAGTTVKTGATLDLNGITTSEPVTLQGGTLANTSTTTASYLNGTLTLDNVASNEIYAPSQALYLNGQVTGFGGFTKTGGHAVRLSNTENNYTGATVISSGYLDILADEVIPNGSPMTVNASVNLQGHTETIHSLTGNSSGYIYNGTTGTTGTLKIGAGNTDSTYAGRFVASNGTLSIVKIGTGTLTLSGDNTYTGTTEVQAGVLKMAHANALGSTATGTTVKTGATLDLNGITTSEPVTLQGGTLANSGTSATLKGTLTLDSVTSPNENVINPSGYLSIEGKITGPGGFTKTGSTGSNAVGLSNTANDYTGATVISSGYLDILADEVIPDGSPMTVNAYVNLRGHTETIHSLTGTSSGFIYNGTPGKTGTLKIGAGNTDSTYAGQLAHRSNYGTLSIVKIGTGTLTLSGDNTYTGTTEVQAGVLKMAHANALGSTATGTTVKTGATLDLNGITTSEPVTLQGGTLANTSTTAASYLKGTLTLDNVASNEIYAPSQALYLNGQVTGSGGFTKTGGHAVRLSNTENNYTGATVIAGGYLDILADEVIPNGSPMTVNASVNLQGHTETIHSLTGNSSGNIYNGTSGTTGTLKIGAGNTDSTYAGRFVASNGTLSIVKIGTGTLTLSGDNTYTGTTDVQAGKLALVSSTSNNNIPGSSVIQVGAGATLDVTGLAGTVDLILASGQTLQGNGTVSGNVQTPAGTFLGAGMSPGHLTILGSYTQTGTLLVELAGYTQGGTQAEPGQWTANGYDWVSVGGSAVLDGYVDIALLAGFQPATGDVFNVLTAASGITDQGLEFVWQSGSLLPAQYWTYQIVAGQGNEQILQLQVGVPEPTSLSLMSLGVLFVGGAGIWASRRRRNR